MHKIIKHKIQFTGKFKILTSINNIKTQKQFLKVDEGNVFS